MEKYIIENGITYELRGEQYYPVFQEPEQYQIGKYGLLHLEYIKAHHKPLYSTLLMESRLNGYLHEIDEQAWEMSNCKVQAEEIVLREIVYSCDNDSFMIK